MVIKKEEEEDDKSGILQDKSPRDGNTSEDDFSIIDLINSSYISYESCDTPSIDSNLLGYTCNHCFYSSKWKQKLRSHIITNHLTKENCVWCVQCQKSFRKESSLEKHRIKNHRNGIKTHKCNQCSFVAKRGYNLSIHIENVHKNKRTFNCPHCLYSASRSGTLKRHISSLHNRERPYSCPHCDFDATRSYTVKIHIETVHKRNKPSIQCSQCSYTTTSKGALCRHKSRTHKQSGHSK